jgi:hypothetical protein
MTIALMTSASLFAQSDSALNRSVTVERDFQPIIQAAGKVSTKPAVVETNIEPTPIEYSHYTASVQPTATFNPLLSQPTRFEPTAPYKGYVRGAVGHPNTLFGFGYHLDDGKNSILDVHAGHHAEWGTATLSKSKLGLNFKHTFSTCDLYFGVEGGNIYYNKYGHWYDYATFYTTNRDFGGWEKNEVAYAKKVPAIDRDLTSLWTAEAFVGVRSNPKQDIQYKVQTGYMLFSKPGAVSEHQIRTHGSVDWSSEAHHVGANIYVQNNFRQLRNALAEAIPDSLCHNIHNFRIEPYYVYEGKRVRVHVGVNLDLNLGRGQNELSGVENLSFAPSPHINLEAQIAKQWLTIYADIEGSHGFGTLQDYMEENRYRLIHQGIIEPHAASYTPVDAELGLHIRPYRDLLFEIHGGYAYMIHQDVWVANADSASIAIGGVNKKMVGAGDFTYFHTNYQRGKVGGQINYHLRDILRINVNGDYYFWSGDTTVYDRPNWELAVRIDGRIDKHWSVYSDNKFVGGRKALVYNGATDTYTEHMLRPILDCNLGVEYNMWVGSKGERLKVKGEKDQILRPEPKPNLTLFLQLNNWLHHKNEIFYGYRSQGINFLLGATYRF